MYKVRPASKDAKRVLIERHVEHTAKGLKAPSQVSFEQLYLRVTIISTRHSSRSPWHTPTPHTQLSKGPVPDTDDVESKASTMSHDTYSHKGPRVSSKEHLKMVSRVLARNQISNTTHTVNKRKQRTESYTIHLFTQHAVKDHRALHGHKLPRPHLAPYFVGRPLKVPILRAHASPRLASPAHFPYALALAITFALDPSFHRLLAPLARTPACSGGRRVVSAEKEGGRRGEEESREARSDSGRTLEYRGRAE